jgi:(4S)-4-hydroxy-5-phosphonooxypentane-2,3-dione isomerase
MYVNLVHVQVRPENVEDFIEATRRNHVGSTAEPGNVRFDVLQLPDDPCRFLLYEAWVSAEDAAAHRDTKHYQVWRDTVAEWMAEPRSAINYKGLFPSVERKG